MTEFSENCCWNDFRDLCPLQKGPCSCACHQAIEVTVHGKYGHGPMPVEFRDVLVEMVRLVKQAIDDGTLPRRSQQPAPRPGGEEN